MRHAFLIMAHEAFDQLKLLIKSIDDENNGIYIHIDKKCKFIPYQELQNACHKSNVHIYHEMKIFWGHFSQTACEIFLMEQAAKDHYDYYHLLSGSDLILISQNEFHQFFENNKGKEFINIDQDILGRDFYKWFQVYHPLQKYIRMSSSRFVQLIFWKLAEILIIFQRMIGIDRVQNCNIIFQKGANWFSITDDLVHLILEKKNWIYKTFMSTRSSDEMFIQTVLVNSELKNNQYVSSKKEFSNLRYIDWDRGSPYIFRIDDYDDLITSGCIFARKFDMEVDKEIVYKIVQHVIR